MIELILDRLRHEIVVQLCMAAGSAAGITDGSTWAMLPLQDSAPHQGLNIPLWLCEIWSFLTQVLCHQLWTQPFLTVMSVRLGGFLHFYHIRLFLVSHPGVFYVFPSSLNLRQGPRQQPTQAVWKHKDTGKKKSTAAMSDQARFTSAVERSDSPSV